jgi:Tfp pilus assembly protein PilF
MTTMKAVIRVDPKNANALNYLGYTYADLGQNLDEAERLIKTAMQYKPNDGYITDSLGWVYFKKGRFAEALEMLTKAIALVPEDPIILEHLGDIHVKMNDVIKAPQYYQRSLELRKKDKSVIEQKIHELVNSDQKIPNS